LLGESHRHVRPRLYNSCSVDSSSSQVFERSHVDAIDAEATPAALQLPLLLPMPLPLLSRLLLLLSRLLLLLLLSSSPTSLPSRR
jgi:hypothetical protein